MRQFIRERFRINDSRRRWEPGALSKMMANTATASILRKDYETCNTKKLIYYNIKSEDHLKLLDKRYYVENDQIKLLDAKKDTHLIGQIRGFYSPMTCSSHEGICSRCYGTLYEINKDLYSAGNFGAIRISEPLGQRILGAKHSQVTSSDLIKFTEGFYEVFELNNAEVVMSDKVDEDLYVTFEEGVDYEDAGDEEFYTTSSITILDQKLKTKFVIREDGGSKFILGNDMVRLYKKLGNKRPIPLCDFDDDSQVLFYMEVKSSQVTESMEVVKKVLNSKDHVGCNTLDEIAQLFLDSLIGSGIKYNAVHGEMLLRQLLRKKSNILEQPCFDASGDHDDYQILTLESALIKNPSPIVSMASGDLRRQLISPLLYQKKSKSNLDPLFMPSLEGVRDEDEKITAPFLFQDESIIVKNADEENLKNYEIKVRQ